MSVPENKSKGEEFSKKLNSLLENEKKRKLEQSNYINAINEEEEPPLKKQKTNSKRKIKQQLTENFVAKEIAPITKKTSKLFNTIKNSKAAKVLLSPVLARSITISMAAIGITLGILTLSGVGIGAASGFVLAPQIAIPLAVLSVAAVSVGIGIDTFMVRRTRLLHKENKHLSRHCIAKDAQDKIIKQHPELDKILEQDLYSPKRDDQKSLTNRHIKRHSHKRSAILAAAVTIFDVAARYSVTIVEAIVVRNPVTVLRLVAFGALGVGTGAAQNISMSSKRHEFRKNIDKLRDRKDTPGYNNLKELRIAAREQKIQALALQELVSNPDYKAYTETQKRESFQLIKENIESREKAIQSRYTVIQILKDVARAHNPFTKYTDPNKLSVNLDSAELKINEKKNKDAIKKEIAGIRKNIKKTITKNSGKKDTDTDTGTMESHAPAKQNSQDRSR